MVYKCQKKRQLKQNPIPSIELKKILVHFLIDDPDSTIKIVNESIMNKKTVAVNIGPNNVHEILDEVRLDG